MDRISVGVGVGIGVGCTAVVWLLFCVVQRLLLRQRQAKQSARVSPEARPPQFADTKTLSATERDLVGLAREAEEEDEEAAEDDESSDDETGRRSSTRGSARPSSYEAELECEAELSRALQANKALEDELSELRHKLALGAGEANPPLTKPHMLVKRASTHLLPPVNVEMSEAGLRLWVSQASGIPKMDRIGHSDTYVVVDIKGAHPKVSARTRISTGAAPRWNQVLTLAGNPAAWPLDSTTVRLRLYDQDSRSSEFIGQVEILLADLIRRPVRRLLVSKKNGDPVISASKPPFPCELVVGVVVTSLPSAWPVRSDQIRSDQIRSDQIRSDQIRSDQI